MANSTYRKRSQEGYCIDCGKVRVAKPGARCKGCCKDLATDNDTRREDRRNAKHCPNCDKDLAQGLATCLECAKLTEDVVDDWFPLDSTKPSKRKTYVKMMRAEKTAK